MTTFKKAIRQKKKLRCALLGPSGAGKTKTALRIAKGMGGKIALIDTEHGSASMYADEFDFDELALESFAPDRYIEALKAADDASYDVVIVDSLSHAWSGKDGVLEFVDRTKKNGNSFNAWGDATPMHNRLIEALLSCRAHLIVTMRTKMDHVQEKDPQTGKTVIRKVGMQPVQRDGMEYEFDVVADIDQSNILTVSKTRISSLAGVVVEKAGEQLGKTMKDWLDGGVEPITDAQKEHGSALLVELGVTEGKRQLVQSINNGSPPKTAQEMAAVIAELTKRVEAKKAAETTPAAAE